MTGPKTLAAALVTTAFVTGIVGYTGSSHTPEPVRTDKIAELFDPAVVRRSTCGLAGVQRKSLLHHMLQAAGPQQALAMAERDAAALPTPLYDDLGSLNYDVTTDDADAQAFFNQGLRFTYAFNHAESVRSFAAGYEVDPTCAMCAWGEAYALGPNINAVMAPQALEPAMDALARAQAAAVNVSAKEQAMIEALATRYGPDAADKPAPYNRAFATAMLAVQARYPNDPEIALVAADAIMNEAPWSYWQTDGRTNAGRNAQGIALVEQVLADTPDHPGAIHLYIHLMEASMMPEKAEPYADTLSALMPGAGHIVHMPSHIYYRVGRYIDSLNTNKVAVEVDEEYFQRPEAIRGGLYELGYYPHNVHFVMASAQMAGDAETSLEYAAKVDALLPIDAVAAAPVMVHPVKAAPLFAYTQFADADTILALPDPGMGAPYVKAMWHYARAVAFAKQKKSDSALTEVDAIAEINNTADFLAFSAARVPANALLSIAQNVALGRIAQSEGDLETAIARFEAGASIQDTINYMEPPYWYYPVRQSLGATYVAAGRVDDAIQAFKASLIEAPNNAWSLYGLQQAYEAKGDETAAGYTNDLLQNAWIDRAAGLDMNRL